MIKKLLSEIAVGSGGRATGFAIGNTSDIFDGKDFYPTPLRQTSGLIYAGAVVKNVETAGIIAELVDGRVEYIFVDAEKKIRKIYYGPDDAGNIERIIREKVKKSNILTYKGNDLTVEATDLLLGQLMVDLGRMHIGIVGSGNLGSKVALKLVERGAHVKVFRRNLARLKLIVDGLNAIKSDNVLAAITFCDTLGKACKDADIIIACANEKEIISKPMVALMNPHGPGILIDAGKGCFSNAVLQEYPQAIYRVNVTTVQQAFFDAAVKTRLMFKRPMGRITLEREGITLVSTDILGRLGEIVVDNINAPTMILGVADGKGSFFQDASSFEVKLNALKKLIEKNNLTTSS